MNGCFSSKRSLFTPLSSFYMFVDGLYTGHLDPGMFKNKETSWKSFWNFSFGHFSFSTFLGRDYLNIRTKVHRDQPINNIRLMFCSVGWVVQERAMNWFLVVGQLLNEETVHWAKQKTFHKIVHNCDCCVVWEYEPVDGACRFQKFQHDTNSTKRILGLLMTIEEEQESMRLMSLVFPVANQMFHLASHLANLYLNIPGSWWPVYFILLVHFNEHGRYVLWDLKE